MAELKPRSLDEYHVFLASPGDVEQERQALRKFFDDYNRNTGLALGVQFRVLDWENYGNAGAGRPQELITKQTLERYKESLALVIGLMAQRFGSPTGEHESGTEEEYEWAYRQNKKSDWPKIKWFFRKIEHLQVPTDAKKAMEALQQWEKVQAFRAKVKQEGDRQLYYKEYTDLTDFREILKNDLEPWLIDADRPWSAAHRQSVGAAAPESPPDPSKYLERLHRKCRDIDIQGLQVGSGKAHRFRIDELYIPLSTAFGGAERLSKATRDRREELPHEAFGGERQIDLRECLSHRCLAVLGDPGAGKTTFLRRVAFELCRRQMGDGREAGAETWTPLGDAFPIFIPLAALSRHQTVAREQRTGPLGDDVSEWLVHFAASRSRERGTGLDEAFFSRTLQDGRAILLLDALDEVPTPGARLAMRKLIENAAVDFDKCRFIVTSRPGAIEGDMVLADFEQARIEPLDDEGIETFLAHWCRALWSDSEQDAKEHLDDLLVPLRKVPEIKRMARNPVMLTALAVVHWNEKRLPEQRAELYESIIGWLAKRRPQAEGRPRPEQCVALLQNLALAMQDHHKGRQAQVARHWGAKAIAPGFRELPEDDRVSAAESFLAREEVDSGIVVGRGEHDTRFWHLTFQEYLAARGLAARSEKVQAETLLATEKLHQPEWREVVLLLAGVLQRQGPEAVDGMFETVLGTIGKRASLQDKARCVGLLNAVLRDLGHIGYKPQNERYDVILKDAMGIFDAKRSHGVDIKVAIEAAEALGQAGDPRFHGPDAVNPWVTIPACTFLMGRQKDKKKSANYDPQANDDETPHEVTLSAYRIGRYPVTVEQYGRFVEDGGYGEEAHWQAGGFNQELDAPDGWDEQAAHPTRPVINVSWYEAAAYAAWADCRLPIEAEWERAASGEEARIYPWGEEKPDPTRANYGYKNVGSPSPVGVYPRGATPEGVLDMAGNVWEWCADWYGNYRGEAQVDPLGPKKGDARVLRGGAWDLVAFSLRSANRYRYLPDNRLTYLGFRLAAGT